MSDVDWFKEGKKLATQLIAEKKKTEKLERRCHELRAALRHVETHLKVVVTQSKEALKLATSTLDSDDGRVKEDDSSV